MCVKSYADVQQLALHKLVEFEKSCPDSNDYELRIVQFAEHFGFEVFEDHLDCSGK